MKINFIELKNYIKYLLKKYFYTLLYKDKLSSATQINQVILLNNYKNQKSTDFDSTGFKVFSQFEEDGKLLYLFSKIGMQNKIFVDIGSHDCINSNCANLAVHFNWNGLFIDADKKLIETGKKFYSKIPNKWSYKQKFEVGFVTTNNINQLILKNNIPQEISLLSIDIDGNDYWIWKEITCVTPKVVVIECQVAFGISDIVTPYKEIFNNDIKNNINCGASVNALIKLGLEKGYRLIGSNDIGNNLFFIQNNLLVDDLPTIDVKKVLQHQYAKERIARFEKTKS